MSSSITAPRGPAGPKGDKGDKGDTGDTGPTGPAGADGGGGGASRPDLGGLFAEYLFNEVNQNSHFDSQVPVTGINLLPSAVGHFTRWVWQLAGDLVVTDGGFRDPTGGSRASRLQGPSGGATLLPHIHGQPAGVYTQGCWMANNTGTDVVVRFNRDGGNYGDDITLPAMVSGVPIWGEYFDTRTDFSGGDLKLGITSDSAGDAYDILIYGYRVERGSFVSDFNGYTMAANTVGNASVLPTKIDEGVDIGDGAPNAYGFFIEHPRITLREFSLYQVFKWPSSRTSWNSNYGVVFETVSSGDEIIIRIDSPAHRFDAAFGSFHFSCQRDVIVFNSDQWLMLAATFDGSVGRLWINNLPVAYAEGTNEPVTATGTALFADSDNFDQGPPIQVGYASIYNKGHSVSQVRGNFNFLKSFLSDRIAIHTVDKFVVIEGDDGSFETAGVESCYAQSGIKSLGGVYVGRDMATSGATIADLTDRLPQLYENFVSGVTVILSILIGDQDLSTTSPSDVMTALTTYINTAKTQAASVGGVTLKVMVGTLWPTTGAENASIPAYNSAIMAATGLYDAVFDFGGLGLDPTSGDYQGGGHIPTQDCNDTKLRPVWLAALASLFP
jgi:hypothetical protein